MERAESFFRYWGKADANYEGAAKWHPFAYHSLDVAAVADAFWASCPAVRRAFITSFAGNEDRALRAWILFFVALHDLGKLHALFQIKAPDALAAAWPGINTKNIRTRRPYDHGCEGFAQADAEIADWIGTRQRASVDALSDWLGAVTGHHGSICHRDQDNIIRGYAAEEIRRHDAAARRAWVEKAAELFLAPAGLTLADLSPTGNAAARNLLAGFCSLCDWIGSNATLFGYKPLKRTPEEYLAWATKHLKSENALQRFGLTASVRPYGGVFALLKPNESPRGIQTLVDQLSTGSTLTIVEAPTGSGKTEAALESARSTRRCCPFYR